jgi:hypothetical protein
MKDRGESFLQLFFRMMGHAIAQQAGRSGQATEAEMLLALFAPDRSFRLKRLMATQLEDMGGAMRALDGPDGSTLITERNKVALDVLKKQIEGGKKRIGIFYGAGHLPDMEQRLLADFKLKEARTTWFEAWDLRAKPEGTKAPRSRNSSKAEGGAKDKGAKDGAAKDEAQRDVAPATDKPRR